LMTHSSSRWEASRIPAQMLEPIVEAALTTLNHARTVSMQEHVKTTPVIAAAHKMEVTVSQQTKN
jgi:hypothetical protein